MALQCVCVCVRECECTCVCESHFKEREAVVIQTDYDESRTVFFPSFFQSALNQGFLSPS